jgi:hypothetical protein
MVELSTIAGQWGGVLFGTSAIYVFTEPISLAVALPGYLVLRHFWKVRLVQCLVGGMLIGLVPTVVGFFHSSPGYFAGDFGGYAEIHGNLTTYGIVNAAKVVAVQSLFGASIGLSFWVIGYYRRGPRGASPSAPEKSTSGERTFQS